MKRISLLIIFLFVPMLSHAQQSDVQISDLRVSEPIPGQRISAGYLAITNSSEEVLTLISVEANFAARVEFHQSMNMNGMNQMRPLQSVHIAPGETVQFEPGGRHLMLMGLDVPHDTDAELSFNFANGLVVTQSVEWMKW